MKHVKFILVMIFVGTMQLDGSSSSAVKEDSHESERTVSNESTGSGRSRTTSAEAIVQIRKSTDEAVLTGQTTLDNAIAGLQRDTMRFLNSPSLKSDRRYPKANVLSRSLVAERNILGSKEGVASERVVAVAERVSAHLAAYKIDGTRVEQIVTGPQFTSLETVCSHILEAR